MQMCFALLARIVVESRFPRALQAVAWLLFKCRLCHAPCPAPPLVPALGLQQFNDQGFQALTNLFAAELSSKIRNTVSFL